MQAVIFADRIGAELAPLCDNTTPALLHVANRPLLQYTIEDLAVAGVDEILLVISDDVDAVRRQFGDGAMWGLRIQYLLSRGEEHPNRLLNRFKRLLRAPFLAARGDILRTLSSAGFLAIANSYAADAVAARSATDTAGLMLVNDPDTDLSSLAWPLSRLTSPDIASIDLRPGKVSRLDSLRSFYDAAMEVMHCRECHQGPPGLEIEPGLFVGRASQVNAGNRTDGQVVIGSNTWIHPKSRISGPSSVGDDCYIDRGAEVDRSIVMPGTYIGEELTVSQAIVSGNTLLRMDSGTRITLNEQQLLASTVPVVRDQAQRWPQQVAATLLLLASLPLWPLALFISLWRSPGAPMDHANVAINPSSGSPGPRRERVALFASSMPLLRHLPLLFLAVKGKLSLFGARPIGGLRPPARTMPAPHYGLLGPAQLFLSRAAPEEEIQLSEMAFTAEEGIRPFFSRLLQAARLLVSARAWRAAAETPGQQ